MNSVYKVFPSAVLLCALACTDVKEKPSPPNIIVIMSDDMGYSDLGAYGGEINTPNLDSLAYNGLRFTQFYNTARCCPTRASLLTGLYPQQAGIGHMMNDRGTPAYRGDLSRQAVTLAEVLRSAGYATYMSGKWHVTPYVNDNPDQHNWPLQRGFDQFFGMISGAGSHYDPRSLTLNDSYIAPPEDFYTTTDFTDRAIQYINGHKGDRPFFLYLAYTAPHWPIQAPKEEVVKYKGVYNKGWTKIREERYQRMGAMGLLKKEWDLSLPDSLVDPWPPKKDGLDWDIANMEVYGAMIDIMDQGVGRIVEVLRGRGKLENTLILYLQDNGACAEELEWVRRPDHEFRENPLGAREPQTKLIPDLTRDGKPVGLMREGWPGPPEGYTAYGRNWANASNTPFRQYKHWVHEGGIATPLIAHWPKGIKEVGGFVETPSHLIDIMATCVEVSGAVYPATYNNNEIQPLEGVSLVPTFKGDSLEKRTIYWEHEGNRAVRLGKWKLVSKAETAQYWDETDELPIADWELYDMEKDRTETTNLASEHPEMVQEMRTLWMDWARRVGAVPRPKS